MNEKIAELIKRHDQYISPYMFEDEARDELDHAHQTLLDIAALVGVDPTEFTYLLEGLVGLPDDD